MPCPIVHTRTSAPALPLNAVGCIASEVMNTTIQYSLSIVDCLSFLKYIT